MSSRTYFISDVLRHKNTIYGKMKRIYTMWKRTQILQLTPNLEYILQNFFSSSLVFHHKYSTFSIVIGKNKTKYSSFWFTSILSSDLQSKFRTLLLFLSLILSSSQVFSITICNRSL
jgi:hypothetical protein